MKIKLKNYKAKIFNTKIRIYPDTGADISSLPIRIINKHNLKPYGKIKGLLINGSRHVMKSYKVPIHAFGQTKTILFAGMNKRFEKKSNMFIYFGKNALKAFNIKSIEI